MWTLIAVISVVWIGYFLWARADSKRRRQEIEKKKDKPLFRSEEDLPEYGKPMSDEHQSKVDLDDAE